MVVCIPNILKVPILKYLGLQSPPITAETIYNDLHGFIRMHKQYRSAFVKFYVALTYDRRGDISEGLRESEQAYKKAVNCYRDAIELMPNLVNAHVGCGIAHAKLNDFDSSIHHFREAIDWKFDEIYAHNNLGNAWFFKGNFDLAIKSYDTAIKLNPDYASAYLGRASVNFNKDELNLAIKDYTKAIDLEPHEAEPYFRRGVVWLCLKQWEKANSDLTTAKEKGLDIVVTFRDDYKDVSDFEQKNGVKLPEDFGIMLTHEEIETRGEKAQDTVHPVDPDVKIAINRIKKKYERAWKTLPKM